MTAEIYKVTRFESTNDKVNVTLILFKKLIICVCFVIFLNENLIVLQVDKVGNFEDYYR